MSGRIRVQVGRRPAALRLYGLPPDGPQGAHTAPAAVAGLMALRDANAAAAELEQATARMATALDRALAALPQLVADRLARVAGDAAELGLAVATGLADGALDVGRFDPVPLVQKCLRELAVDVARAQLRVLVGGDDLARVVATAAAWLGERGEHVRFAVDPSLARGAVRVEADIGMAGYDLRAVCARIAARIREELAAG
ncbi:MAG: hypothetical protein IPM29_17960 [Planctomycetes bacterium]|nr:hypothetical protein [Planctomycetota bacterium]